MFAIMKFAEKIAAMSLQELEKYEDTMCNKCIASHMGRVYCETHECSYEKLLHDEINFRKEMMSYVRRT